MDPKPTLKELKMRRIESQLKKKLWLGKSESDEVCFPKENVSGPEDSSEKVLAEEVLGFKSLFLPFNPQNEAEMIAKVKVDVSWFDPPVSILPRLQPTDTGTVLQIRMKNQETANTVLLGLKAKYPELELDQPGKMNTDIGTSPPHPILGKVERVQAAVCRPRCKETQADRRHDQRQLQPPGFF